MSLFNKDFQNRSGLKVNIVYTDLINDIPIENYLNTNTNINNDNIVCETLSGLIVTSNKINCNYLNYISISDYVRINNIQILTNKSLTNASLLGLTNAYNITTTILNNTSISDYITTNNVKILTNKTLTNGILNDCTLDNCNLNGTTTIEYATIGDLTLSTLAVNTMYCYESFINDIKINDANGITKCNISNDGVITTSNGFYISDSTFTFQNTSGTTLMTIGPTGILSVADSPYSNDNSLNVATTGFVNSFCSDKFVNLTGNENINGTKTFLITPIIINQYLNGSAPLRTANFSLSIPYYELYPLANTTAITITIPVPNAAHNGVRLKFRRVGGIITTQINSTVNIYPNGTFTPTTVLIAPNATSCSIMCCNSAAGANYAWFIV